MSTELRLHVQALSDWLATGQRQALSLPSVAVRHAQVRRMQPGQTLLLFDGQGQQWRARLDSMGRQSATATLLEPCAAPPELPLAVTLAVAVPTNERMDSLVEKAAELGVAAIQPLMSERSVLRLEGERAAKRVAHWQAVANSACEQCGRASVPRVQAWQPLAPWLHSLPDAGPLRCVLLPGAAQPTAAVLPQALRAHRSLLALSGPEGGFSAAEEALVRSAGFTALSLGPLILRADTAPLALMAWLSVQVHQGLEGTPGQHP